MTPEFMKYMGEAILPKLGGGRAASAEKPKHERLGMTRAQMKRSEAIAAHPAEVEEVIVAKKFLEEHPEEVKKEWGSTRPMDGVPPAVISRFLGWPIDRVRYSLERLGLIDEAVRVAKKFLEENPEEVRKSAHGRTFKPEEKRLVCHGRADQEIGSPAISEFLEEHPEEVLKLATAKIRKPGKINAQLVKEFLGWTYDRILDSLERLGLIDEGIVEPDDPGLYHAEPGLIASQGFSEACFCCSP